MSLGPIGDRDSVVGNFVTRGSQLLFLPQTGSASAVSPSASPCIPPSAIGSSGEWGLFILLDLHGIRGLVLELDGRRGGRGGIVRSAGGSPCPRLSRAFWNGQENSGIAGVSFSSFPFPTLDGDQFSLG